jgi:hypothetical protein
VTPLFIALAAIAALVLAAIVRQRRRRARESFIDDYAFPRGIRERVRRRYPHLSEADLDLVFEALREYFHLCRRAGRRLLAMPSQVVDVAWHEFILFTRNYEAFCRRALGRFLHHTPTEAMPSPTMASDGIRRTWRLACRRAGIDPLAATAVPLLFAIDDRLAIADGFRYAQDCSVPAAAGSSTAYCASHIGCGGGCGSGCSGSGCSGGGGSGDGGDGGGCGGGGGD